MSQISSADRLLMAENNMIDTLKHPHPDVPLYTIGDDTITPSQHCQHWEKYSKAYFKIRQFQ
jgi:hypothetical protein